MCTDGGYLPANIELEKPYSVGRPKAGARLDILGEPIHVHFEHGGSRDLESDVPATVLEGLRKRLHDVLWRGTTPDNLVYENVVKLFLAKTFDEKTTGAGNRYRFQIFYVGQERETPAQTFKRISTLYVEAYSRYVASSPRDKAEPLDRRSFSPEQIAFVVELLQEVHRPRHGTPGGPRHQSGCSRVRDFSMPLKSTSRQRSGCVIESPG